MYGPVFLRGFLLSVLLIATSAFGAEGPVLTPLKPGGVYALGERAGWTVSVPAGAKLSGEYSYKLKKNNFDVIKSGRLKLSQRSTIEISLNEPAMLYLEVTGPEKGAKPVAYGAAIAPTQLRPVVPRPADFEQFWAEKIAQLRKVPANPVLTQKDSGRPDVDYYILQMDHIDGRHIYGQVAKPKHAGKFPGLAIFQWASPPYPLQREWVTERAAEGWLAVNIEPHDVLPDQPKEYYDALPKELKEYTTIGQENRDKNYFTYMYLADYRAIEYLASRPDWNGQTLIASGTSMGGQQSLCAAGLNPKVTGLIVHVASGADANGPLHGRASGYPFWPTDDHKVWPADNPKVMATMPYVDTVNCAMNIKVPSLVSMGFIDVTSPPVGIFTAFNQI
ncbi:MAG TPA: acetylxylan esterase, partial [Povalibacter sp.]